MPFHPQEMTEATFKGFVDRLHRYTKTHSPGEAPKRAWCQEAVARALGFPSSHAAHQALAQSPAASLTKGEDWSWRIISPSGITCQPKRFSFDETSVSLSRQNLSNHVLLMGREMDRARALEALVNTTPQMPLLIVRGNSALPVGPLPGLPEHRFNVITGYGGGLDCLFQKASASKIGEAIVSMMGTDGGDNSLWKGRAVAMLSAVLQALVWLRDHEGKELTRAVVRDHLPLANLGTLMNTPGLPAVYRQALHAYLAALPGYSFTAERQSQTAEEQHGFLQMQFTRILGMEDQPLEPLSRLSLRLEHDVEAAEGLTSFMETWVHTHRDGLLVLDGLESHSSFFGWIIKAMGRLELQGHGVVVGARTTLDLPDGEARHRLLDRLEIAIGLHFRI